MERLTLHWLHCSSFFLKKTGFKDVNFFNILRFLPLKEIFVATQSETCALTFKKYVLKQDLDVQHLVETFKLLWLQLQANFSEMFIS